MTTECLGFSLSFIGLNSTSVNNISYGMTIIYFQIIDQITSCCITFVKLKQLLPKYIIIFIFIVI